MIVLVLHLNLQSQFLVPLTQDLVVRLHLIALAHLHLHLLVHLAHPHLDLLVHHGLAHNLALVTSPNLLVIPDGQDAKKIKIYFIIYFLQQLKLL